MADEAERNGWMMRIAASASAPAWSDVVMELKYQVQVAYKSLHHGASKEEVVSRVESLEKLMRLPQEAVNHQKQLDLRPGKPEQGA